MWRQLRKTRILAGLLLRGLRPHGRGYLQGLQMGGHCPLPITLLRASLQQGSVVLLNRGVRLLAKALLRWLLQHLLLHWLLQRLLLHWVPQRLFPARLLVHLIGGAGPLSVLLLMLLRHFGLRGKGNCGHSAQPLLFYCIQLFRYHPETWL